MADGKLDSEELKKLIKRGRKQRLPLAFCPGAKDDNILLIDKRKKPDVLARAARKQGTGNKVAFGTFTVEGKVLELTCEHPLPALAKNLKRHLKKEKIRLNVVVLDMSGSVLESDIEELPDDPSWDDDAGGDADGDAGAATDVAASPADPAEPTTGPAGAAPLVARLKALHPGIIAAPQGPAGKLQKAVALAVALIKSGNMAKADATIAAIEAAIAKLAASAATPAETPAGATPATAPADLRQLAGRAKALQSAIAGISGPANSKLAAALNTAIGHIKARELATAETLLGRIEDAAGKARAAMPTATESTRESTTESPTEAEAAPSP
jgi:hypothetical protein